MNRFAFVAVSGILLASSMVRAEVIVNGGFVKTADPVGWTISGNTAGMNPNTDRDTDGDNYYLGMASGNDDTLNVPNSVVYQVVDVTAGQAYDFSLDHTAWATPGAIFLHVDIFDGSVDSTDLTTNPIGGGDLLAVSLTSAADRVYQTYNTLVTSTQGQVTVRLSDIGNTTLGKDLWVDNVQMSEAVPEPASVVSLVVAGLAGLGLSLGMWWR